VCFCKSLKLIYFRPTNLSLWRIRVYYSLGATNSNDNRDRRKPFCQLECERGTDDQHYETHYNQLRNMFIISSTRNFVNFCLRSIIKRLVSFTFTDALMNCIQSVYCRPLSALKACTPPVNYALLSSRPVAKDLYATALSVCLSVCLWLLPLQMPVINYEVPD